MAAYTMYLSKVGRLRVTVNGCKVVWFLGIREAVDAGSVEQFLPWALHGFKRRGVARTTLTYFICTVEGGKAAVSIYTSLDNSWAMHGGILSKRCPAQSDHDPHVKERVWLHNHKFSVCIRSVKFVQLQHLN